MQEGSKYRKEGVLKSILEEPGAAYESDQFFSMANHHISKKYIKGILEQTHLTVHELIGIIPISIDSYKRNSEFKPPVTEKVLEIQEVYTKGLHAFGDSFYSWMDTTNVALGGVKPKKLLANSFGVRLLLDEIGKMEHGILS
jgi:uncharacterized protein (DUF2384 family)